MIITKMNDDLSVLVEKLQGLKYVNIIQAFHSYGTMFVVDMGERSEKMRDGKIHINGDRRIIVENYTWKIAQGGMSIVDSHADRTELRRKVPLLVGKKITDIKINTANPTIIEFKMSEDVVLEVTLSEKKERDLGIRLHSGNWIDVGFDGQWQEVTGDHVD